jgi:hypothetical protein
MYTYIIRRLAFGALTVAGMSMFVVLRVLPGDPLVAIFGMERFTNNARKNEWPNLCPSRCRGSSVERGSRAAVVACTVPGCAITLTVLAFSLLGDDIRDMIAPRLRRAV